MFGLVSLIAISYTNTIDASSEDYDQQVKFVAAIEETMRHILAAKENIIVGNKELATLHLSHPIVELYDDLHNGLKNHPNIDQKVELVLFILKNTNTELSGDDFDKESTEILKVLNEAKSILIQKELDANSIFKLDVMSDLLEMAKMEYSIAMESGENSLRIVELQDAYAFVVRAEIMLDTINDVDQDEKK